MTAKPNAQKRRSLRRARAGLPPLPAVPDPVAGPLFMAARSAPTGGAKRRKLLCTIAGYADAGETSPPARELARWTGLEIEHIDVLLSALERDGLLRVRRKAGPCRRNVYELRLGAKR